MAAAVALAAAVAPSAFALPQLPLEFVLDVFLLLPADQRLRCAEVSRAWRGTVALPALWTRLDLSPASGVTTLRKSALLRAVAAFAPLRLCVLHLNAGDALPP